MQQQRAIGVGRRIEPFAPSESFEMIVDIQTQADWGFWKSNPR
jgi:hypothetical protein